MIDLNLKISEDFNIILFINKEIELKKLSKKMLEDLYNYINLKSDTVLRWSTNKIFCRIIQSLLGYNKFNKLIIDKIKKSMLRLILNKNGNFVMTKMLETVNEESLKIIIEEIKDNYLIISKNIYGCRLIIRLIVYFNKEEKEKNIINFLIMNFNELIYDNYGIYVLGSIIELKNIVYYNTILIKIYENFLFYSIHFKAAYVVERLLNQNLDEFIIKCNLDEIYLSFSLKNKQKLKDEILEPNTFLILLTNDHGLYVIKSLLNNYDDRQEIKNNIKDIEETIKKTKYYRIITQLIKKIEK